MIVGEGELKREPNLQPTLTPQLHFQCRCFAPHSHLSQSTWSKPAPVIDVSAVADLAGAILTAKKPSKKRPKEDEKRKESKRPKKEKKDDGPTPEGKVRVMHILKKHIGSSRPSSWKEKVIKRTIEEAHVELEELRGMILEAGGEMIETFKSLASEESDCSSAKKQVRLGGGGGEPSTILRDTIMI